MNVSAVLRTINKKVIIKNALLAGTKRAAGEARQIQKNRGYYYSMTTRNISYISSFGENLKIKNFSDRMPERPYCSDNLGSGLRIRGLEAALRHKYIQLNPPGIRWALVFDIDYAGAALAAEDSGLPPPTFAVCNRENGHAHLIYALSAPVCTSPEGHLKPLKYLAAIEAAYCECLKADRLYTGLIAKNPWRSDFWHVISLAAAYSLEELARYVDLTRKVPRRPAVTEIAGLGRNCYIFEKTRRWSYRAIRRHWESPQEWERAILEHCARLNARFANGLHESELRVIARSIGRWTQRRFRPEEFSEWQRRCVERRWTKESRKAEGFELLRAGRSVAEVMEKLGVGKTQVYEWRKEAIPEEERRTITELKPWEIEGVSRATWYRKNK